MEIDFSSIKLVIWDLDDTFWKGTLSEGEIQTINKNHLLVKLLSERGIINTICSKNDEEQVVRKLEELQIKDYFVFNSINWTPKGKRIQSQIKEMGLRPQNCLFIDDNIVNLNEAKFYSPELIIAEPSIIPEIENYLNSTDISDPNLNRLKQYKILEEKHKAKTQASNNLDFLYASNTQVDICHDCISELDRIHELVNRTNQLNYTKIRSSKEDLRELLSNPKIQSGYVKVKDNFGDYGIVGFYALDGDSLIHFLFSCRTIGQGVEQYVYAKLKYPELKVNGEVVSMVTKEDAPKWINQEETDCPKDYGKHSNLKVIFKGGCDLMNMSAYLNTDNVVEEFTYISKTRKNNIEHHYHTTNLLSFPDLSKSERDDYLEKYLFADEDMFDTQIFDDDVAIIFIGTMIEPNLGVYRNNISGKRFAFGECNHPLTDPNEWDNYISNSIFTADNHFTKDWLEEFSRNHTFLGSLSPTEILEEYKELLNRISPSAKMCFLLGSEMPFEKESNPNYIGREKIYKEINDLIKEWSAENPQVIYIDFNDYIHSQSDFTNNINHFQRRVYYEAALKANLYISEITGETLEQKGKLYVKVKQFADNIGNTGFFQTKIWAIIRKPYIWLRGKL